MMFISSSSPTVAVINQRTHFPENTRKCRVLDKVCICGYKSQPGKQTKVPLIPLLTRCSASAMMHNRTMLSSTEILQNLHKQCNNCRRTDSVPAVCSWAINERERTCSVSGYISLPTLWPVPTGSCTQVIVPRLPPCRGCTDESHLCSWVSRTFPVNDRFTWSCTYIFASPKMCCDIVTHYGHWNPYDQPKSQMGLVRDLWLVLIRDPRDSIRFYHDSIMYWGFTSPRL